MNTCKQTGKTYHADKEAAMAQLRSLRRRGSHRDDLEAFKCPHCGGWHLGHRFQTTPRWGRRSV